MKTAKHGITGSVLME